MMNLQDIATVTGTKLIIDETVPKMVRIYFEPPLTIANEFDMNIAEGVGTTRTNARRDIIKKITGKQLWKNVETSTEQDYILPHKISSQ